MSLSRNVLIAQLRAQAPDLRAAGIDTLYLFGSFARDQARPTSDIDLLVSLSADTISLIGLIDVKQTLEQQLGRDVDITTLPLTNPFLRAEIDRDSVRVF